MMHYNYLLSLCSLPLYLCSVNSSCSTSFNCCAVPYPSSTPSTKAGAKPPKPPGTSVKDVIARSAKQHKEGAHGDEEDSEEDLELETESEGKSDKRRRHMGGGEDKETKKRARRTGENKDKKRDKKKDKKKSTGRKSG